MHRPVVERILAPHRRRRDVVVDGISEDMAQRGLSGNVLGFSSDYDRQLWFRVSTPILGPAFDHLAMAYERRRRLHESSRMLWSTSDSFRVGTVIECHAYNQIGRASCRERVCQYV